MDFLHDPKKSKVTQNGLRAVMGLECLVNISFRFGISFLLTIRVIQIKRLLLVSRVLRAKGFSNYPFDQVEKDLEFIIEAKIVSKPLENLEEA